MNYGDRKLLPISLGHIIFQASLGDPAPNDPPGFNIDDIKHGSAILVSFHRLPGGITHTY